MGLGDLLHSALVLFSCAAYGLPLYEAVQRRSVFYVVVLSLTITLSFALHCEESGICRPYAAVVHERLRALSQGVSLFLLGLMTLVAFEIRAEAFARSAVALWAAAVTLRDADDLRLNIGGTLLLGVALLGVDAALYRRTFSPAWWRRLSLIATMALGAAGIFRLVHSFWWHGVWHVYLAGCVHLLLLAQRTKRMLAKSGGHVRPRGGAAAVAPSAGASSGVAAGGGEPHAAGTPMKRRGDAPPPVGAMLV